MRTRLWKEIRGLGPWFVLMMACGVAAFLVVELIGPVDASHDLPGNNAARMTYAQVMGVYQEYAFNCEVILGLLAGAQIVLLYLAASSAVGLEFSLGSIQRMLAQPISRNRIWLEKTLVLGVLLIIALLIDSLIVRSMMEAVGVFQEWMDRVENAPIQYAIVQNFSTKRQVPLPGLVSFYGLMAMATAPTISLWLRKTHTVFWASIVLPAGAFLICLGCLALIDATRGSGAGTSMVEIIMSKPSWADQNPMVRAVGWPLGLLGGMWIVILYAVGWLKFRRLEV